jgi:hypothetical protein
VSFFDLVHLETICCESLISTLANFPRSFEKKIEEYLVVYVDKLPAAVAMGVGGMKLINITCS